MEENDLNLHILKTVKKTTYNAVINKALNINPENSPMKTGFTRSHSFKKILNFVPQLKPRKSTFIPTPLKLNNNNNINKVKEDDEKKLSGDEIQFIESDSPSSSSISSSDMNNSSEEGKDKDDKKEENEIKKQLVFDNKNFSINIDKIESNNDIDDDCDSLYLNEIKDNMDNGKKNKKPMGMKSIRKKLSQIRAKIEFNKFKEIEGVIHDNFKENYDIGLKKYEKEDDYHSNFHGSFNVMESKKKGKISKPKSIFEVLSNSKNTKKL